MKKLLIPAFLLAPFMSLAQKSVDLDRYRFSVQYRSLPGMQLDSSYRTYSVESESTEMMQHFMQDLSPEKTVKLEGWKKLDEGGHLLIQVKLGDLLPEAVTVKERTELVKNRSGQVTGSRTYFHQEVVYTFSAKASISDYKGRHILDEDLASRNHKQVYRSPEFANRAIAEGYFVINSISVTRELYQKCVNRAMHNLSERISNDFGFREVAVNDFMWIIDTKKHPEYAAYRKAFMLVNEVLFSMNPANSIDGARETLKPAIDYFEKIKKTYSSGNRHDRKIRYASYYNLAVLYYYLDDPESMMREASGLVLNDFDSKDGKAFEQSAINLKNLFKQNNIYTRHFPINTDELKGPYEQDVSAK